LSKSFDDGFVPEDEGEPETEFEPDIATVAFLDQQQAEFGSMEQDFEATYGFKHECHCGEDYAAGKVGEITQCYHNMMQEALANCARLNAELKEMTGIAQGLYSELLRRVEAEEGTGEVSPEPESKVEGGLRLVEEPAVESESGSEQPDPAADDAAGEGFGAAHPDAREESDTDPEGV
jgi:hypothetical protein